MEYLKEVLTDNKHTWQTDCRDGIYSGWGDKQLRWEATGIFFTEK